MTRGNVSPRGTAQVGFTPRAVVQTGQVASAAHLAAAGLGVTLLPDNVVPGDLDAAVRRLRSPIARKLAAFTRRHEVKQLQEMFSS